MKTARLILLPSMLAMESMSAVAQADGCGVVASLLSCGNVVSGNTSSFTPSAAPMCFGVIDGTAGDSWYRITGTGAAITISLCGSSYDSAIRIFSGPCALLVCVASNNDFCGLQSQVTWTSTLGLNYYILIQGVGAAVGAYTLTVTCATSMDACGPTAPTLVCGSVVSGDTSPFGSDVAPVCTVGNSTTGGGVWYQMVGTGANITASLCGSSYDTAIRVYSGTCAALTCVTGNGDFCGLQSQVTWTSTAGVIYWILVHGFGTFEGPYTLAITCAAVPPGMCYSTSITPFLLDPHAGTAVTLTDDQHSGLVPIGFNFCFNGTTYTQCVISSNNYISFNPSVAGTFSPWVTVTVPNLAPAEIRNTILGPWQDLYPPACAAGCIRYQTLGSAPNRRFVVSYLNVPMFSCTLLQFTSQMVLYEGSNCVGTFLQTKPVCATWNGGKAVHALHNGAGTQALVVAGRNNTSWIATNEGRYFSPTCAPCSTAATASCALPTPVELLHFTGHHSGTANVLEWATASEQNSDYFTVERSEDGVEFVAIGVVQAAGSSNAVISYVQEDGYPAHGVNYYRLRATDLDGTEELSDVISMNNIGSNAILVFPNPVQGALGYQLPEGVVLPTSVVIRDLAGREVREVWIAMSEGTLDVSDLPRGSYFLELSTPGPAGSVRIVID